MTARPAVPAPSADPVYVLWVIPDRGGGWSVRDTADSLADAEAKRKRLYSRLGDVSVRVLRHGEKPWNDHFDVSDSRRGVPS